MITDSRWLIASPWVTLPMLPNSARGILSTSPLEGDPLTKPGRFDMTTRYFNREIASKVLGLIRPAFLMIAMTLLMLAGVQKGVTLFISGSASQVAYPEGGSTIPTLPAVQVNAPTRG